MKAGRGKFHAILYVHSESDFSCHMLAQLATRFGCTFFVAQYVCLATTTTSSHNAGAAACYAFVPKMRFAAAVVLSITKFYFFL